MSLGKIIFTGDKVKILSFDPGLGLCGFALSIDFEIKLYGVLETSKNQNIGQRLVNLDVLMGDLIHKAQPNVIVAEKPTLTMGGNNVAIVNYAYAVLLMNVSNAGMNDRFIEYVPGEIKKEVTGSGKATKDQVLSKVKQFVALPSFAANMSIVDGGLVSAQPILNQVPDDATDAVAINWTYMLKNGHSIKGL